METCFLLSFSVVLNFRNFQKLNGIKMDPKCKNCEEIKKQNRKREKKEKQNK
jgi:hypothetical protein